LALPPTSQAPTTRSAPARPADKSGATIGSSKPVKLRIGKQLSEGLTVRLDRHDREELERRASEQGIGPLTLVRIWIKERLRGTQHPSS
jgi:hypothetical protein